MVNMETVADRTSQFGLNPKNLSDLSKPYLEQEDAWADGASFQRN